MASIITAVRDALRASAATAPLTGSPRPRAGSEAASSETVGGSARPAITFRDLQWLVPFIRPHWRLGAVAALIALVNTVAALLLPFGFKAIVDGALQGGDDGRVDRVIWTVTAVLIVLAAADFVKGWYFIRFQQQVILGIQRHLFRRVLGLPKDFFDAHRTGYVMSRVVGDVFELRTFLSLDLVNVLMMILQLVGALAFLLYLNWRLTLLSLAILPLFVVVTRVFSARLRRLHRKALETSALVSQELEETLSASALIKAFGSEEREAAKVTASLRHSFDANLTRSTAAGFSGLLSAVVNAAGMGCVLWYGARQIASRQLTIGELLAFSAYLGLMIGPARFLAGLNLTLQQAYAALERVLELLHMIQDDAGDDSRARVDRIQGRVAFEHVSFSYAGSTPALDDVSFAVGPRQLVAIVGPSGAGKSTLVNLILGLYQPVSGSVRFDDWPSGTLNRQSLRERIGIVSQEVFLFDDSIRNNIRYGRPDVSNEAVMQASQQAGAHEFIAALPGGYETVVGGNGVKLSVGQKQRISIARALLKDPDILIFDEATSALDAVTEQIIRTMLTEMRSRKTVFVVAHRLATVLLSDVILVLENGRIVQSGTHHELWREDGLYRRLCQTELGGATHPDDGWPAGRAARGGQGKGGRKSRPSGRLDVRSVPKYVNS
jgi:subfamily B ATP-binding cassette protein MsbA